MILRKPVWCHKHEYDWFRLDFYVVVSKYAHHIPLERLLSQFSQAGVEFPKSTVTDWIKRAAEMLFPLREVLRARRSFVEGIFRQTRPGFCEGSGEKQSLGKGEHHLGYYWAYSDPVSRLVIFDYQKGRSRDGPAAFLEGFEVSVRESISLRIRKPCTHNICNESLSKKPDYRTDTI